MSPSEDTRRLRQVQAELAVRFPDVPQDKVRAVVEYEWMQYLHATVREYVPLLVAREARSQLRALH